MNNQKGFGLVEGLLILAVVIGLGFGGYYVYSQNSKDNSVADEASSADNNDSPGNATRVLDEINQKIATLNPISQSESIFKAYAEEFTRGVYMYVPVGFTFDATIYEDSPNVLQISALDSIFTNAGLVKYQEVDLISFYRSDDVECTISDSLGVGHAVCELSSSVALVTEKANIAYSEVIATNKNSSDVNNFQGPVRYQTSTDGTVQAITGYIEDIGEVYLVNEGNGWVYLGAITNPDTGSFGSDLGDDFCSVVGKSTYKDAFSNKSINNQPVCESHNN